MRRQSTEHTIISTVSVVTSHNITVPLLADDDLAFGEVIIADVASVSTC